MNKKEIANHCFLIRNERVEAFQQSPHEPTIENIYLFVDGILRGGRLSKIAEIEGIDYEKVVLLSNFTNSFRQLSMYISSMSDITKKNIQKQPISFFQKHQERGLSEIIFLAQFGPLLEHFGLDTSEDSIRKIEHFHMGNSHLNPDILIEYLTEKAITTLDDVTVDHYTEFLRWGTERHPKENWAMILGTTLF